MSKTFTKTLILMIGLTGCCSFNPVKKPNHFEVKQYRENKMRHPNLYPLTENEQFSINK